ncbi:hypothetical protein XENOCAPTIV_007603 [Xenoophorus captivus]|uniref:Uncharacterized protein n=1 Tax=Xenoophorus captivus TaxID=1517983 RepID=A0ABV0SE89_9TELE
MLTANLRCTRFTPNDLMQSKLKITPNRNGSQIFRINSDMGYKYSGSDPKTNGEQNKQKWKVSLPSQALKGDKQSKLGGLTKEKISKRTAGSSDKNVKTKITKCLLNHFNQINVKTH